MTSVMRSFSSVSGLSCTPVITMTPASVGAGGSLTSRMVTVWLDEAVKPPESVTVTVMAIDLEADLLEVDWLLEERPEASLGVGLHLEAARRLIMTLAAVRSSSWSETMIS